MTDLVRALLLTTLYTDADKTRCPTVIAKHFGNIIELFMSLDAVDYVAPVTPASGKLII